jgi:hypothetical protein
VASYDARIEAVALGSWSKPQAAGVQIGQKALVLVDVDEAPGGFLRIVGVSWSMKPQAAGVFRVGSDNTDVSWSSPRRLLFLTPTNSSWFPWLQAAAVSRLVLVDVAPGGCWDQSPNRVSWY